MRQALFASIALAPTAWADNFTLSFTNTDGNVPGTVTVLISGLTNNSTGAASSVTIESYPSALNPYAADPGNIATNWTYQDDNVFTETNGKLTSYYFDASTFVSGGLVLNLSIDTRIYAPYNFFGYGNLESNDSVYIGAVETPSAVPEPATAWFVLGGLGVLAALKRRRTAADIGWISRMRFGSAA
jgi:hypothetical protein